MKRDKNVKVRLNSDEVKKLENLQEHLGLSMSEVIRLAINIACERAVKCERLIK